LELGTDPHRASRTFAFIITAPTLAAFSVVLPPATDRLAARRSATRFEI
jgi:hypothetical protein